MTTRRTGATSGSWTHLALELDLERDDALVEQLRLAAQRSFEITVKNPRAEGDAGLDDDERPELPDELQDRSTATDGPRATRSSSSTTNGWSSCSPPTERRPRSVSRSGAASAAAPRR
jgi:hypothetical protein